MAGHFQRSRKGAAGEPASAAWPASIVRRSSLRRLPVALDLLGQAPFMDFGRTVIDAEGADFPERLLDDGVAGHARPAHHLDAAVGDAKQRRSEEHTSELQSLMRISYAVFCLKKKNTTTT